MNDSIWNNFNEYGQKVTSDMEVDTLVIGGGLCGVLCAYYLKEAGKEVILVEADKLGNGITKNTTAVVSSLQDVMYQDRVKKIGFEKAKEYLDATTFAINEYQMLAEKFDFDYEEISNFMYNEKYNNKLKKEHALLNEMGFISFYNAANELPFKVKEILEFKHQAQINPLKLILELEREIEYFTNTKIIEIVDNVAFTGQYYIKAKNIIIATQFPFFKLKGLFGLKMYQKKSYVISFKTQKLMKDSYIGIKQGNYYFRKYNDEMIIGACDIKTGYQNEGFSAIENLINAEYEDAVITHKWTNQDNITLDDIPYIGKIDKGLYVATGFNMWGMTSSILAAFIIKNLIINGHSKYEKLFDPKRKLYKKQLNKNIKNAIKHLLTFNQKRCTHLGCALRYNASEDTYECPCHGSKYDKNGKVLVGPALKDLKKDK